MICQGPGPTNSSRGTEASARTRPSDRNAANPRIFSANSRRAASMDSIGAPPAAAQLVNGLRQGTSKRCEAGGFFSRPGGRGSGNARHINELADRGAGGAGDGLQSSAAHVGEGGGAARMAASPQPICPGVRRCPRCWARENRQRDLGLQADGGRGRLGKTLQRVTEGEHGPRPRGLGWSPTADRRGSRRRGALGRGRGCRSWWS